MATHYLPSSGWYSTSNSYIFYRFKIDESISGSTRSVSVAVQAYKSASSTANTTTKGTFYLTINGTAYNGTIAQDTNFYADGVTRTYHTATPSIAASTTSLSVSGYFDVSRFTSDSQGGTISLTSASANQCVYVRYQQADGTWGNYSPVINTSYTSGATVSWSRAADAVYKAASISYTATTSSKTSYVDVYRQTYVQTINVAYQNADGTFGGYSTDSSSSYYYGATFNKTWGGDITYKTTTLSYTVTGTVTKSVDVYRNEYPIYFDSNGGVFTPSPQYYIYGGTTQLQKYRPTRSGYNFLGWNLNSNSTVVTYQHLGNYTFDDSEQTLYAVWEKVNQDIYLYNDGTCYVSEFIEDDTNGFGSGGRIYSVTFDESESENGTFEIGDTFIGASLIEGVPT